MISEHEDSYESPIWLNYQLKFVSNGKRELFQIRKRIEQFEKSHPALHLIHVEHATKEVRVCEKTPLFQDENGVAYYPLKYSFLRHTFTLYFRPDEDLHSFLSDLQSLIEKMRKIREKIKKCELIIKYKN